MNSLRMICLAIPWVLCSVMTSAQEMDTIASSRIVVLTEGVPTVVDLNVDGTILAKIMEVHDYFEADFGDQHYIDLSYHIKIDQPTLSANISGAAYRHSTVIATRSPLKGK